MYAVRFVGRNDLPKGHAWAMVRVGDGSVIFFVKRCEVCARVLEEAWAAYRRLASQRTAA